MLLRIARLPAFCWTILRHNMLMREVDGFSLLSSSLVVYTGHNSLVIRGIARIERGDVQAGLAILVD